MSAVDQTITLAPVLPAEPIVLCNAPFLHTLAVVEREIATIAIADAQSMQAAANLKQRLTTAGTALEAARKKLKAPFLAKGAEIDEAAKAPAKRILEAKAVIDRKLVRFDEEQREAARKAELERQAELERLEKIRREEEDERRRKEEELAEQARLAAEKLKAPVESYDFDDEPAPKNATIEYGPPKTETELAIEKVKYAPPPEPAKPTGIRFVTRLLIDKIDVNQLPDAFVIRTAKEQAIRATFCTGWKEGEPLPECPGVTFKIERTAPSTGRSVF